LKNFLKIFYDLSFPNSWLEIFLELCTLQNPSTENPMIENTENQKRLSIRFPFTNSLEWSSQISSLKIQAQSKNMSLHGMLIASPVSYPNENSITIRMLGSAPDVAALTPLCGHVVWMREEENPSILKYSFGVKFHNPEHKALLVLVEHAIVQLTEKIEKNPDDVWLYRFRGDAKKAKEDSEGAGEDYNKAKELAKSGGWRR
jgi:hypothetical protein